MRTGALLIPLLLAPAGRVADAGRATVNNLEIPGDLPEKSRAILHSAIEAYRAAEKPGARDDGRLVAAIRKLESAREKVSRVPLIHYYLGIAYQRTEKFLKARTRLQTAVRMNPKFHEAFVELGDVYVWLKDLRRALGHYETALEIAPTHALALDRKAQVLIRLGKFEEARSCVVEAQKIESSQFRSALMVRLRFAIHGPSWKETFEEETDHFVVKTSVSEEFAREIGEAAERIRRAYTRVFPPTGRPQRKFPILVHSSKEEYHRHGGPPGAGGHYDMYFRMLFLFRYPKKEQTILVLNHEAFHQFIDDYVQFPPQWFNEGVAEYFGAFQYVPREKKLVPRPNRMRLNTLKAAIRSRQCVPGEALMLMSRRQMYDPRRVSVHYAQAWGMVYFMLQVNRPQYRKALVSYFHALRRGKDIDEAFRATFGKLDLERFNREWMSFILRLR